jgi:hypothetical protein
MPSSPRAIKILAIVLAGVVALSLIVGWGIHLRRQAHALVFDTGFSDGPTVKQVRALDPFDTIEVRNHLDLDVTVGPVQSVTVEAEQDGLRRIDTQVVGHALILDSDEEGHGVHIHVGHDSSYCHVTITVPALHAVHVSGNGKFKLHQLQGDRFGFDIDGAGEMVADGKVDALSLQVSGAARIDTSALQAGSAEVVIDGVGSATVRAQDKLTATVDGIGRIVYLGNPHTVYKHVEGLGTIRSGD